MQIAAQLSAGELYEGIAEIDDEVVAQRADVGPCFGVGRKDLQPTKAVGEEGQRAEVCELVSLIGIQKGKIGLMNKPVCSPNALFSSPSSSPSSLAGARTHLT